MPITTRARLCFGTLCWTSRHNIIYEVYESQRINLMLRVLRVCYRYGSLWAECCMRVCFYSARLIPSYDYIAMKLILRPIIPKWKRRKEANLFDFIKIARIQYLSSNMIIDFSVRLHRLHIYMFRLHTLCVVSWNLCNFTGYWVILRFVYRINSKFW